MPPRSRGNLTPLAIEGGTTHYLALDPQHSVLATINQNGTTTATYTYDPWGQTTVTAANGSGIAAVQLFGYAGGIPDPTTGLEHFGHRWYDPTIGRFTQQDDIQTLADPTRANPYEYAGDNPVNYVDPSGLDFRFTFGPKALNELAILTGAGNGLVSTILGVTGVGAPAAIVFAVAAAIEGVSFATLSNYGCTLHVTVRTFLHVIPTGVSTSLTGCSGD